MTETTRRARQQKQVDDNYEAFQQLDDRFFEEHYGKCALMRDRKVVEVFDSWQDARKTAMLLYKDKFFSLQKVDKTPIDLGIFSHGVF